MEKMDEQMEIQDESLDEVGSLIFSPPPMIKSDTKDSISSIDSDISISFDRRCSKDEEADLSDSASGTDETDRVINSKKIKKITINSTKKLNNNTTDNNNDKINNELKNLIINNEIKNSSINNEINNIKNEDDDEEEEIIISDELAEKITSQVEFYFSDDNIIKDAFLLKHVKRNKEGYVSLKLISSFKRVKHLSRDWRVVGKALRLKSKKLQVNELGTKLRRLNPLPQYDQTLPSRTIIVSKLPIDKLTIENVAEIFRKCGEIALIRILRPGHPVPAEVRQAIAKKSELGNDDECALIEFTDSSSARNAQKLIIGNAKIYELQQFSSNDKKRKQQQLNQQKEQQNGKKNLTLKMSTAREKSYINSSSCPSGSEDDIRNFRISKNPRIQNRNIFAPVTSPCQGPPSPDVWLPRRFSACSIGSGDNTNNLLLRRLSGCSNSGSNSDTGSYPGTRRFSSCSSSSENGYSSPLIHHHHQQQQSHQNPLYPSFNYWTNQTPRRFSCCTTTGTTGLSNNIPAGYGFDYNSAFYQTGRRASADCGPFLRRLSNCSRDSGYDGTRRASSCSSSSDSCSGFRSRSNSGFVLMAHLPENVTRMPSGPDGTRGFGRNNNHSTNHPQTIVPSC